MDNSSRVLRFVLNRRHNMNEIMMQVPIRIMVAETEVFPFNA